MSAMTQEQLQALEQAAIEQAAYIAGAERAMAAKTSAYEAGSISRTLGAQVAHKTLFVSVLDAVNEIVRNAPPASQATWKFVNLIGAEKVVQVAMTTMFNGIGKNRTTVASSIGRQLGTEIRLQAFNDKSGGLAKFIEKQVKKATSVQHKMSALRHAFDRNGVDALEDIGFTKERSKSLGLQLMDTIISKVGAFYLEEALETKKGALTQVYFLRATDALLKLMADAEERVLWMHPVRPPMVTKPKAWDETLTGGYYSDVQSLEFMKGAQVGYLQDALQDGSLSKVFSAMNTLQNTPYRINKRVLEVLQAVWDGDLALGSVPVREPKPDVPKPNEAAGMSIAAFKEAHPEAWKAWRKAQTEVHKFNQSGERASKLLDVSRALTLATEYKDHARLYFPVQNDFRGRMYYVTDVLNPQTSDIVKATLEFAEGVPMRAEDEDQLAIVGATLWANNSLDKLPMEQRIEWVHENDGLIRACARDPLGHTWWAQADGGDSADKFLKGNAAFMFLAWCFEWNRWKTEGEGALSHYIAFADGKCNGSQHHAALMRAETEAGYVCMLPMKAPDDLYSRVLEKVVNKVADGAFSTDYLKAPTVEEYADDAALEEAEAKAVRKAEVCEMLRGKLKRSHVKRACMTYSYGVTELGVKEQLATDNKDLFEQFDKRVRKAMIAYVAKTTLESVREVVKASAECMKFLQDVASVAGKSGLPVQWITPDGMPILQKYNASAYIRVRTIMAGDTNVKIDRSMRARKLFFKSAKAIAVKTLGDKEAAALVLDELDTLVTNTVFKKLGEAYKSNERHVVKAALVETFGSWVEADTETMEELSEAVLVAFDTVYAGRTEARSVDTNMRVDSPNLDKVKQVSAMAPNFIHSLDACHMRMTINACAAEGITSFAGIHDSYGVHIGNYKRMNTILREQFVDMYTKNDPLQELLDIMKYQLTEAEIKKLPARPEFGTLDLNLVKDAKFFFA